MDKGVEVVPAPFRHLIKGVFSGHSHVAKDTDTSSLHTQVGAITQHGKDCAFYLSTVNAEEPEVIVGKKDLFRYKGPKGQLPDETEWKAG